jgi:dissimilatory sulfite reductase related protein
VEINVDGEGYLVNREEWRAEIAEEIAQRDGYAISEEHWKYINAAREMYEQNAVVPPIRKFAKAMEVDAKYLYELFPKGPMKMICKVGGLPKPTGCV